MSTNDEDDELGLAVPGKLGFWRALCIFLLACLFAILMLALVAYGIDYHVPNSELELLEMHQ